MALLIINQPANGQLAQSPVLFKVSDVDLGVTKISCALSIWMGQAVPATGVTVYNLSKTVTLPDQYVIFDVSQFIKDLISPTNITAALDPTLFNIVGFESAWIECVFSSDADPVTPATSNIIGCTAGFRLYQDPINNPAPTIRRSTNILYTGLSNKVYLSAGQNNEAISKARIDFDLGGFFEIENTRNDLNFAYTLAMYLDVSPSNAAIVGNFENYYTVTFIDGAASPIGEPIKIVVDCEPKYDPYTVAFINRYGSFETIAFNKTNTQDFIATSSEFQKDNFNEAAFSYPTNKPQFQRYNTQGRDMITLNTGFVDESVAVTLKELMQTEEAIILETGQPINVSSMSLAVKQSINKQMIQYTLSFEFANQYQSTIR